MDEWGSIQELSWRIVAIRSCKKLIKYGLGNYLTYLNQYLRWVCFSEDEWLHTET